MPLSACFALGTRLVCSLKVGEASVNMSCQRSNRTRGQHLIIWSFGSLPLQTKQTTILHHDMGKRDDGDGQTKTTANVGTRNNDQLQSLSQTATFWEKNSMSQMWHWCLHWTPRSSIGISSETIQQSRLGAEERLNSMGESSPLFLDTLTSCLLYTSPSPRD